MLEAVACEIALDGVAPWALDVAALAKRSGVGVTRLRGVLGEPQALLEAVLEEALSRVEADVAQAFRRHTRWLDAIKAALLELLGFIEREPALGRLLVVYATGGGEPQTSRAREVMAKMAAELDSARGEPAAVGRPPLPDASLIALGAATAILQNGLLADRPREPMELFGSLVSALTLPYLGPAVARREMSRPAPRAQEPTVVESFDDRLRPELPYRTRLALEAIAAHPGASNREVAERAGIVDQGQVSKLLSRLAQRGLIEKLGERRTRGAPNAWQLTARGESLIAG